MAKNGKQLVEGTSKEAPSLDERAQKVRPALKATNPMSGYALLFGAALVAFPSLAQAGLNTYECVIVEERNLTHDGKLDPTRNQFAVGQRFHVDRITGVVLGARFMTPLDRAKATVVDRGSKEQSFRVVYIEDKGRLGKGVEVLIVEEYVSGLTKPFVAIGWDSIVSGTCT